MLRQLVKGGRPPVAAFDLLVATNRLVVFVLLVLFVVVAPIPVFPLFLVFQPTVFAIGFVPRLQPFAVDTIFSIVPVVVVAMVGVVNPAIVTVVMLFALLTLSEGDGDNERAWRC
jgi:hypothetical protein